MAKRQGKIPPVKEEAVPEKEPFEWEDFDDGSGHMISSTGRHLYGYDRATGEVQDGRTGKYGWMGDDGDWRARCEQEYMEKILPSELREAEMRKQGIYCPAYQTVSHGIGDCTSVFVSEGVTMPVDEFQKAVKGMRHALYEETKWDDYASTLSDREAVERIARNMQPADERNICCSFSYCGEDFRLSAGSFRFGDGQQPNEPVREAQAEASHGGLGE